jgi:hypothetical protein
MCGLLSDRRLAQQKENRHCLSPRLQSNSSIVWSLFNIGHTVNFLGAGAGEARHAQPSTMRI